MINQWEAAGAAKETVDKDAVRAAEIINAKNGQPITWTESGLYFQAKVVEATVTEETGQTELSIFLEDVQYKKEREGDWTEWTSGNSPLRFAQDQLSVKHSVAGTGKVEVNGVPYGPTRIEIG